MTNEGFEENAEKFINAVYRINPRVKNIKSEIGKIAGQHGFLYLPKEIVEYEDSVLYLGSFAPLVKTSDFDQEIRKDIVVFKREKDGVLEEYRFDKEVYDGGVKRARLPSPKGMKRDLRATIKLLIEKKENPFEFYANEKLEALGYTPEEIKKLPGSVYQRVKQNFVHLALMRYLKWDILPGGEKRLSEVINSPYTRIVIPKTRGDPYTVFVNIDYLRSVYVERGELKPGKFRTLPSPKNPYTGKRVEEKAFEWLTKNVKGRSLSINTEQILRDKLILPEQYYKRKEHCLRQLARWLWVAREEGYEFIIETRGFGSEGIVNLLKKRDLHEIENLLKLELETKKLQDNELLGDCRKWKIDFYSPIEVRHPIGISASTLADKIIRFLYYEHDFGIRMPEKLERKYILHYIGILGEDMVREIFEGIKDGTLFAKSKDGKHINQAVMLFNKLKEAKTKRSRKG